MTMKLELFKQFDFHFLCLLSVILSFYRHFHSWSCCSCLKSKTSRQNANEGKGMSVHPFFFLWNSTGTIKQNLAQRNIRADEPHRRPISPRCCSLCILAGVNLLIKSRKQRCVQVLRTVNRQKAKNFKLFKQRFCAVIFESCLFLKTDTEASAL